MATLNDSLTANGSSDSITWKGGEGSFLAQGTFDSGTLALQFSIDDGSTWTSLGIDTELTDDGGATFRVGGCLLRVNLSGASSPDVSFRVASIAGVFM